MNRLGTFIIAGLIVFSAQLYSQPAESKGFKVYFEKMNITEKQKEKFEKMRVEMEKESIELRAKIPKTQIEFEQLLKGNDPKRIFIKSKLNEIARLEVELRMLRIELWFDINDELTPEQQKIWKKALEAEYRAGYKTMENQMPEDGNKGKAPARKTETPPRSHKTSSPKE
jgi:Spy/CpxP family protein refolding chaperone